MFRRKDENSTEFSMEDIQAENGASSAPLQPSLGISPAQSQSAAPVAPAAAPAQNASAPQSPYAPASLRPAASSASTYRPAGTVNDLSRNVSGRTAAAASAPGEMPRSSAPGKANRRVLTVGNDILLKGEIATCDRLVIEGRVEAKLSEVHTVEIAECGSFKGTAEVEDAEISGVFEGDLVVRNRIVIYATGEVRGNISYGEIEIERGGRLTGQIKTVTAAPAPAIKSKAMDVFQDAAKGRTTKEASVVAA